MKKQKAKKEKPFHRCKVSGGKAIKLRKQKEKTGDVVDEPVVDKFIDEETPIEADDAYVAHPTENDVKDVLRDLDGFRDWAQESRGNGLTYGDY
jgi:hypothetical protein